MSGPNNTSTGGYLKPLPQPPPIDAVPANQTFLEFLQTVLTGVSGFPGTLVRPQWQQQPPKQPDVNTNWLAFGIEGVTPDFNAYIAIDNETGPGLQRNELFGLAVSIYGPAAYDNYGLIRDGFQLSQNLASLKQANVGFAYDQAAQHVPDFINEIWYDRWRATFYFRRQIQRVYPILTFASVSGTIYTQTAKGDYSLPFSAEGE